MDQEQITNSLDPKDSERWIRRAIALSWFTILYNLVEGAVSIGFGISEGAIALAGFGVDSLIEVASAFLVLWRFKGESGVASVTLPLDRERKATQGIGLLFLLLAVSAAAGSIFQLLNHRPPDTTVPGFVISTLSLSFMFFLWRSKLRVAGALNSSTMQKDAACSFACIKLSFVLLAGSVTYLLATELWWADSVAALVIAAMISHEGWETIRASRAEDFSGGCCTGS